MRRWINISLTERSKEEGVLTFEVMKREIVIISGPLDLKDAWKTTTRNLTDHVNRACHL
jgi:hypothetical protein